MPRHKRFRGPTAGPASSNYWLYTHTTPDGMVYVGVSSYKSTNLRWVASHYKPNTAFGREIALWGWSSITHEVLATGLTKKEALQMEGGLIEFCHANGVSLNIYPSGGGRQNDGYYLANRRRLNEWYRYNYAHQKVVRETEKNDKPLF